MSASRNSGTTSRSQLRADDGTERPVVLNVEDFEPARFLRSRVLRKAGFEVVEAGTASDALAAASQRTPAVALVDVDLPDGDGFALCERLKRSHPQLAVVLVSAVHISASAMHRGQLTGADAFLREPVPPDMLVRRVTDALEGTRDEASLNWVITDSVGLILEVSAEAAHMLGLSAGHLRGRLLLTYFDGNRVEWSRALVQAHAGQVVERDGRLRPRDRRPLLISAVLATARDYPIAGAVLWTFRGPGSAGESADDTGSPES
jgi:DNA-binding response OmpR family regulator